MSDLTPGDCTAIAIALKTARDEIPITARAIRMKLLTIAREHERAVKLHERGTALEMNPQIRACGSLEPGEYVLLGNGPCRARRATETGLEIMSEGKWVWENVSSRTTPVCVVDSPDRRDQ